MKGPSLGKINVKVPHQRSPYAMKFEDRSHEETERQQRCARSKARNLAKNTYKLKENEKATFHSPAEEWLLPAASTKEPEGKGVRSYSGASMHMVSEKDHSPAELETMRTSRSPTTVMTADGEVRTREEATGCVKQLDFFVKVMLLEETPAVLSMGKLCQDHGYTFHWTSGQKLHLIRSGKRIACKKIQKCIICGSWFICEFFLNYTFTYFSIHLHHRIPYLMSADTPKIQCQKEVEVRVKSFGATRCMSPQKSRIKSKMGNAQKYKETNRMNCLVGYRNSENLVDESTSTEPWGKPEQGCQDTFKPSHELPMEPASKSGDVFGQAQCKKRTFRKTQIVMSA